MAKIIIISDRPISDRDRLALREYELREGDGSGEVIVYHPRGSDSIAIVNAREFALAAGSAAEAFRKLASTINEAGEAIAAALREIAHLFPYKDDPSECADIDPIEYPSTCFESLSCRDLAAPCRKVRKCRYMSGVPP